MNDDLVERVRQIALAIPGCTERTAGEFVIDDALLCAVEHGEHTSLRCASPPGVPEEMVAAEPQRFFHPDDAPGTLGVFLDGTGDDAVDWDEIAAIVDDAHATLAGRFVDPEPGSTGRFRFTSRLWLHTGEAAWCFATVPPAVATAIDEVHEQVRRGFGSRRVRVTIGDTTWATSIFPDASNRSYALPVKKAVRTAEHVGEGDDVEITIELVDIAGEVPGDAAD